VGIDWGSASDQELWSQATNERVGEAFGELFERHADRVYAHCFSRTGSWSMAEDLTSVVFLEAWRKRTARADSGSVGQAGAPGQASGYRGRDSRGRPRDRRGRDRGRRLPARDEQDGRSLFHGGGHVRVWHGDR
jgi:hypothetical protein